MRRYLIPSLATAALVTTTTTAAWDCGDCDTGDYLAAASAVFEGVVVEIRPSGPSGSSLQVAFHPDRFLKGHEQAVVLIHTAIPLQDYSSYPFLCGERYLVFGFERHDGHEGYSTNACAPNRPLRAGVPDLDSIEELIADAETVAKAEIAALWNSITKCPLDESKERAGP